MGQNYERLQENIRLGEDLKALGGVSEFNPTRGREWQGKGTRCTKGGVVGESALLKLVGLVHEANAQGKKKQTRTPRGWGEKKKCRLMLRKRY